MRYLGLAVLPAAICLVLGPRVGASDAIEDTLAATCRIVNKQSSGTCFFVVTGNVGRAEKPPVVLVTSAHFFEGTPGAQCQLILRSQNPDKSFTRKEISLPIRSGDKPLWKKQADVDIAVLALELPDGVAVKPFRIDQLADEKAVADRRVRVGQDVRIPCYPAKLEANPAGWPVLRKGSIATYPLAPVKAAKTMLVDFSAFGGDSGAPVVVISETGPLVAGVVVGMHRQTDKATLPFEERTVHTPLGLALVVQAAFVRELIESLDR